MYGGNGSVSQHTDRRISNFTWFRTLTEREGGKMTDCFLNSVFWEKGQTFCQHILSLTFQCQLTKLHLVDPPTSV